MQVALHAPVLCRFPLLSLAHRRSSKPVPSSSLPSSVCKELNLGFSRYNQAAIRNLRHSLNGLCCVSNKQQEIPLHHFVQGLNQTHFHYDQHKRDNLVRSVVVRSELTGTAIPDAMYPLSDIKFLSRIRGICLYAVTAIAAIFLLVLMWAMSIMGVIPLKRMDSISLECLKKCMDLIKKGASVCSFPEGTRSIDGRLSTFKEGAFSVATKMKVPVVPVTIRGTDKIMPARNEVIDKPIEGSDLELLCNAARDALANALLQRQMKKKTMTE